MSGDVTIGSINIDTVNVNFVPEGRPTVPDDIAALLRQEFERAGDSEVTRDIVGSDIPETGFDDSLTPEEQIEENAGIAKSVTEQMVADIARSNHLRNLVHHVDEARRLEGFQTNHERSPKASKAVDKKQAVEFKKAEEALSRACAQCAFRTTCSLEGQLDEWIDVHPYKKGHKGTHRPGSLPVGQVESRTAFLQTLRQNPAAHCDPRKRTD